MAILKIRDANGNVQEILAIRGEPGKDGVNGKDYVLTDADKAEIADMITSENWGSSIVVDRSNPYDYEELVEALYFPEQEFYWERYLDGTAKIFFKGRALANQSTSISVETTISLPFSLMDANIAVSNYVEDDRSSVICKTLYGGDFVEKYGHKDFSVSVNFSDDGEAIEVTNTVDFEITVTGRWK